MLTASLGFGADPPLADMTCLVIDRLLIHDLNLKGNCSLLIRKFKRV